MTILHDISDSQNYGTQVFANALAAKEWIIANFGVDSSNEDDQRLLQEDFEDFAATFCFAVEKR